MNIGLHTEFDDALSVQDPQVAAYAKEIKLAANKGAFFDALKAPAQAITNRMFHIYGRTSTALSGLIGAWDIDDVSALSVSDALAALVTVGSVLKVEDEVVVVKSVTRSTGASTISVFARGAGGTTAATHANTVVASIVSHAGNDTDLKNVEAISENTVAYLNYAQTIFDVVDYTRGEELYGRKGLSTDQVSLLEAEAMNRILKKLAFSAVRGVKQAGVKGGQPYMTAGLLSQLSDTVGIEGSTRAVNRYNAASAAFSEDVLRAALAQAFSLGSPDTIVCAPSRKRQIDKFNAGFIQTQRTDKVAGFGVNGYEFDNKQLDILPDEDMPADRIAIVTIGKCQKGWVEGDMLGFKDEPNASSREKRRSISGTYGIVIDGVGYDHLDLYGIGA